MNTLTGPGPEPEPGPGPGLAMIFVLRGHNYAKLSFI